MRKNPALLPFRPNVLLKAHVCYMVAYVNSNYLIRENNGNYAVVQAKLLTIPDVWSSGDILRETQISDFLKILQILNGYLEPTAIFHLVSNRRPEKCGFGEIDRANP